MQLLKERMQECAKLGFKEVHKKVERKTGGKKK